MFRPVDDDVVHPAVHIQNFDVLMQRSYNYIIIMEKITLIMVTVVIELMLRA